MSTSSILDLIYAAHSRLSELESEPRDYGTGEALSESEVHVVVAVGESEGQNLTELAARLEISVPAAFKFASKMVRRGYLRKRQSPSNAKEVALDLTAKGRVAATGHAAFAETTFGPLRQLEARLPSKDRRALIELLTRMLARLQR